MSFKGGWEEGVGDGRSRVLLNSGGCDFGRGFLEVARGFGREDSFIVKCFFVR